MVNYSKGENKVHWRDWQVGGVYYRENGTEPFVILDILRCQRDSATYKCDYINGSKGILDTKTYLIEANTGEEDMTTQTLYQIKDKDVYGFKLATNSKGEIVFEVKSTGEILTVNKEQLIEVMPYTVDIKFLGANGQKYAFFSREGDVKVGDVVVAEGYSNLMIVVKTDSRSKAATKWLKGSVLYVSKVIEGDD